MVTGHEVQTLLTTSNSYVRHMTFTQAAMPIPLQVSRGVSAEKTQDSKQKGSMLSQKA